MLGAAYVFILEYTEYIGALSLPDMYAELKFTVNQSADKLDYFKK